MMSLPPISSNQSVSGITLDPQTHERIIPGSKRADGSIRQPRKVRPGYTPQEDIARFRGARQQAMDTNALPKGHILGWVKPTTALNKNARKRASKARANAAVKENWEDEEEEVAAGADIKEGTDETKNSTDDATDKLNWSVARESSPLPSPSANESALELSNQLEKLQVK